MISVINFYDIVLHFSEFLSIHEACSENKPDGKRVNTVTITDCHNYVLSHLPIVYIPFWCVP